jgi:hypothetical protein
MVRLLRSTYDVLMCLASGLPIFGFFSAPMHLAGLYRTSVLGQFEK